MLHSAFDLEKGVKFNFEGSNKLTRLHPSLILNFKHED